MQEKNSYKIEDYDFSITGVLKEGFSRTNGVKFKFIGSFIIYWIIALITGAIFEIIFPQEGSSINGLLSSILSLPIVLPIMVGITMLAIQRARDEELVVPSIFSYYNMLAPLLLAYVVMTMLIMLGFILLIIPGIYLSISYSFTYALIVDKRMNFWDAMELSRKTITKRWFSFFGLGLLGGIIIVISAIPFGIGLIWSVPTVYIAYGLLYHHIFDENSDQENETI